MKTLSALLDDTKSLLAPLKVHAPETILLSRAVAAIKRDVQKVDVEQTKALQLRVADLIRNSQQTSLSSRDLKDSCRTFFHPPHAPALQSDLRETLCDQVQTLQKRSALFALLDAYLDGFETSDEAIRWLAERLSQITSSWPWRDTDTWPEKIANFDLLSPDLAPLRLADEMLTSTHDQRRILDRAGLDTDGRRQGGLGLAAFIAACQQVRLLKGGTAVQPQKRLMDWASLSSTSLAYPTAWPQFAGALFEPWSSREPSPSHRAVLLDRAMAFAGDPRITPQRWRPVEETAAGAYAIILRWLTQTSVRQFFDIVSETMTDRPDMWRERRAFWEEYLDANQIDAAWVAFGSDGARRADRAARKSGDGSLSKYGRLSSGSGRTSQHAALIMTFGDTTIVEWSHNGAWNVWTRGDQGHPPLFRHNGHARPDYDPSELMGAPTRGPHMSGWQTKLARIISNQTGRRP
ncbi:EH signature domain-containing protein [Brevundimonas sp.]|uniref:EH signature domain-containing protein n=1 Tax=Brevundimonas sp. TaxID=1871086 RepID=UPI00289FC897|nr:EH signature domain-containing protein [Brevundimonas sp.]